MDVQSEGDLKPKERSAAISWVLAKGRSLTTSDIARDYEIQQKSAARLLSELSRVLPIIRAESGHWMDVEVYMIDCGDVTE